MPALCRHLPLTIDICYKVRTATISDQMLLPSENGLWTPQVAEMSPVIMGLQGCPGESAHSVSIVGSYFVVGLRRSQAAAHGFLPNLAILTW